jgi:hypothetical protein
MAQPEFSVYAVLDTRPLEIHHIPSVERRHALVDEAIDERLFPFV